MAGHSRSYCPQKDTLMHKKVSFALLVVGLINGRLTACSIKDEPAGTSGPQVHMTGFNFMQDSITINKGETLTLVNDVAAPHHITNGSWIGATPEPKTESDAPRVDLTFNGNDSAPIAPFPTTGTFHLYFPIHTFLNLPLTLHSFPLLPVLHQHQ